jgi:hypothetical protein
MSQITTLFIDATANASSGVFTLNGPRAWLTIGGTFGGATVTIESSLTAGASWSALTLGVFTSAYNGPIQVPAGIPLRATIASASGTTSLTVRFAI